jgi:hypothetical protein
VTGEVLRQLPLELLPLESYLAGVLRCLWTGEPVERVTELGRDGS